MGKIMQIRCVGFASVSIVTVRLGRDGAPVSLLGSVTCRKACGIEQQAEVRIA